MKRWTEKLTRFRLLLASSVGLIALWGSRFWFEESRLLRQAETELSAGNYAAAHKLCEQILAGKPQSPRALELAATAAARLGQHELAIEYLQGIRGGNHKAIADRFVSCGALALELGKLS